MQYVHILSIWLPVNYEAAKNVEYIKYDLVKKFKQPDLCNDIRLIFNLLLFTLLKVKVIVLKST